MMSKTLLFLGLVFFFSNSSVVDLTSRPQAEMLKDETSFDPFLVLLLLCLWGHLAGTKGEALGLLIDSVNDYMEKGK